MDMKEKLVELIQGNTAGFVNPYAYEYSENAEQFADYLIANGIGFVTDNNVGSKWISVKDRLPEEDIRVLVWVGENDRYFPIIDTDRVHKGRWVRWEEYITHWMPLPEPPKEETQQDCTYNKNGHCIGQKLMPKCDPKNCDRRK